jgi:succinylglutamate desuccinylase
LHGNETCGYQVLRGLRDPAHPLRRRIRAGTLVLIHGNPAAFRQRRRFTEGGTDLNRLFDFSFVERLPEEAWTYEHRRALVLRPVLERLDGVLDLHSSTLPSDPFVITSPSLLTAARRLGCRWVTHGWDGPGLLADRVLTGLLHRRGRPAFSVECGQHDDSHTVEVAWQTTERFLELMGMLEGDLPADGQACTVLQVVHRVGKPTQNFAFARPFAGFDPVAPGEAIGQGDGVELTVKEDFRVLLPNADVPVGEDMLYLGRVHRRADAAPARGDS